MTIESIIAQSGEVFALAIWLMSSILAAAIFFVRAGLWVYVSQLKLPSMGSSTVQRGFRLDFCGKPSDKNKITCVAS